MFGDARNNNFRASRRGRQIKAGWQIILHRVVFLRMPEFRAINSVVKMRSRGKSAKARRGSATYPRTAPAVKPLTMKRCIR